MDGKGGGTSQPSFAIRIYIYFVLFRFAAHVSFEHCQMARRHRPRMSLSMRLSSRNAIRSNKICFEAIIYKYCLVLFVFRRDDEANFFE